MRALLFALFALAACAQTRPEQLPPALNEPRTYSEDLARIDFYLSRPGTVAVGLGETADLGRGLRVRPIEVIQDSRCPANVDCVWAGLLQVRVAIAGERAERVINAYDTVTTRQGSFSLVAASPSRWSGEDQPQPPPPYRFGFRRV